MEKIVEQSEAKLRWESLRAQYRKYLAKLKTKIGQAATKNIKWRYADQMQFLHDYITGDRPRISSVIDEEMDIKNISSDNSEEVVAQVTSLRQSNDNEEGESANESFHPVHQSPSAPASTSSTTQRKKIKQTNVNPESASSTLMKFLLEKKKSEQPVDSIDQFFSLMATTVKKFSSLDQHIVKTQVFAIVNPMERKYLTTPSPTFLPAASIHHSQISPSSGSHSSSSSSNISDVNQSGSHGSSRDHLTSSSQHTYLQQQPANY